MSLRRPPPVAWSLPLLGLAACGQAPLDAIDLVPSTLSEGLVAYWSFDDGMGSVAADVSGNKRDGVLTGGTWLDGRFNGALRLGDGEFISVDRFPDATASYSVSAWVRLDEYVRETSVELHWGTIVSTEVLGGWELMIDRLQPTPGLNFGFWKGPNQGDFEGYTCVCLELERWTMFSAVVDGSTMSYSVYVDGEQRYSTPIARGILPGSSTLHVGRFPAGMRFLRGDVDDIAIWDRALVPSEVRQLMSRPPSPPL